MKTKRQGWLMLTVAVISSGALAKGVMLDAASMDAADQKAVLAEIARAKARSGETFTKVAGLYAQMPGADAMKRGRIAPVSPMLKPLGVDGAWAALEILAVNGPARGALTDSAWLAYRLGLIEAVGMAREPKMVPPLAAMLVSPSTEQGLVRPLAEALGRIGDDRAVASLVERARGETGERQLAILSGMGNCRRVKTTELLAATLDAETDEVRAKTLARALSDAGNAGAWRTPGASAKSEEGAVKLVAARSLVSALTRFEAEGLQAASNALLVVDANATTSLVKEARAQANPLQQAKLDAFLERFERNPTRIQ